ncbi:MAG TPA: hypothetical protein DD379_03155 [Cyanobacteria bacterium UBA11162]|nr:hypothetical protein [Cyanobacteria bacterium UBA11162]
MRAVEVTGRIDEKGQLILDKPIEITPISSVRIIILFSEPTDELESDPDETDIESIKASLRRALQQAKAGQRIPLSQMWEGIDAE